MRNWELWALFPRASKQTVLRYSSEDGHLHSCDYSHRRLYSFCSLSVSAADNSRHIADEYLAEFKKMIDQQRASRGEV